LVDQFNRRHTHWTARTVDQRDIPRQQVFQAALDDGVSLPAADLHDRPRAGYSLPDLLRQLLGSFLIAIFTEEFHRVPPEVHRVLRGTRRRAALPLRQSR